MGYTFGMPVKVFAAAFLFLITSGMAETQSRKQSREKDLILNGDFENGLESWGDVKGYKENFSFSSDDETFFSGSRSLRMESLPPHPEDKWAWIEQTVSLERGKTYKLSFYVSAKSQTKQKQHIHLHWPGQKTYAPYEIKASGAADWHNWHKQEFFFLAQANTVTISLPFLGSGRMWIDNITLTESALPDTAKNIIRHGRVFSYQPGAAEEPPLTDISKTEKQTGYLTYFRKNPRDTYPRSVPKRDEITQHLEVSATPGEYASSWFSIYALKELNRVNVYMQAGPGEDRERWSVNDTPEIRTVRCWEQRTGWRSTSYYVIPELLEKNSPVDIPEGQTQTFWLTIRIPEGISPGNYPGKIVIEPEGAERTVVDLTIRILPFSLKEPEGIYWSMWWVSNGYDKMDAGELRRELDDMKEHGINTILVDVAMLHDSKFDKDGSAMRYYSPKLLQIQETRKELKMNGPLILYWGDSLEPTALKSFGKSVADLNSPEGRDILRGAFRALDSFVKNTGGKDYGLWYFLGMDEPGAHPARQQRALLQYTLAKESGINATITINRGAFADKLKPLVKSFCWAGTPANGELNEYYRSAGPEYWFYGSGVYTGQEGGLAPDRYICGFLFYKMQAALNMSFIYARTGCTDDPYDDFDGNGFAEPKDAFIAYPSPDGPVPTLQWEGIREGINDYKYIHTLEKLLTLEEQKNPQERTSNFTEIKKRWRNLVESLPWNTGIIDNEKLSSLRSEVTDLILELTRKSEH